MDKDYELELMEIFIKASIKIVCIKDLELTYSQIHKNIKEIGRLEKVSGLEIMEMSIKMSLLIGHFKALEYT